MSIALIERHVKLCHCTDGVWIGQPDSQRTVDVEGGSCVDDTGCSTVVLSMRQISEWHTERAAHHMDGVRACDTSRDRHTETSKLSTTCKHVSSSRHVVRGSVNFFVT